ncbi:MAG: hypothetical protein ACD_61C00143G0003 [uncultured bacterium]|nr:MAG: hypothetical protein ACD_61C00143G0003 [uncultured bacterium]
MSNIGTLSMEWQEKIAADLTRMKVEGPSLINVEIEKTRFTTTLVIQPDEETRQKIHEAITPLANMFKGLYIQPVEGLHISIQWSDQQTGDEAQLASLISQINPPALEAEFILPFPSKPNLFAVVIPKNNSLWMAKIREKATSAFSKAGYQSKLPVSLPSLWMSLVRFTTDFDLKDLEKVTNDLSTVSIECKKFTMFLAKANPFFDKDTLRILSSKEF